MNPRVAKNDRRPHNIPTTVSLLLLSGAALADTNNAPVLEEITVTAQRLEQNLQRVPVSVTAQSGELLEARGVTDVTGLQSAIPNLNVAASPVGGNGAAQIFVRGVGQIDYTATQEPDVPIYVDGIYIARPVGSVFDFVDVDRVEVLRGPQGTLFGRNTLGGALQVVTQKPTQSYGGWAEVTGGSYGRRDFDGVFNIPLSSTLAARFTASSRIDDGYMRSLTTGQHGNNRDDQLFRGQARWHPDEDTDVVLRADHIQHKANAALQTLTEFTPTATTAPYNALVQSLGLPPISAAMVTSDPYNSYSGLTTPDTAKVTSVSLDGTRNLGPLSIKSITAARYLQAESGFDFAGVPYPLLQGAVTSTDERQLSEELQLFGSTLAQRLSWIVGGYFFHERNVQRQCNAIEQSVVRTGPADNDFEPVADTGIQQRVLLDQVTDTYAVYGQVTYEFVPRWQVVLGARGSWDRKHLGSSVGFFGTDSDVRPCAVQSADWSQFTPKAGLNYQFSDDVFGYAFAAKGYRAGGFNGHAADPSPPNVYGPESLWDYETGIKGEYFDRRLRINVGLFYYDYQNYQANVNVVTNGVIGVQVANAAGLQLYGGELEAEFRASKAFTLTTFLTREDITFHDIVPGAAGSVRADSQPPNAPKFSAGASARYQATLGSWGSAVLRADYTYKGRAEFFLPNFPGESQGGYSLINARLSVTPSDGRYEVSAFGTNISDKAYRVYAQSLQASFGTTIASFAPPAQWGLSVRFNF
ncbi:MAG TPA: TonB-dependent receptor [Steroidobacteraceae bacterium]|nr:TonB-dependent receptor [Steroidobacteraceae bacterium]